MKHVKSLNLGAKRIEKLASGEKAEVRAQQLPINCSTIFDPGWESDVSGFGTAGLCQPVERDLYGCYGDCWWAGQVPDGMTNYSGWHDQCPAAVLDWQKIKLVDW